MASVFKTGLERKNPWTCRFKDSDGKVRQRFFPTEAMARRFSRGLISNLVVERVLPLTTLEREWWRRLAKTAEDHGWAIAEALDACEKTLRSRVSRERFLLSEAVRQFLDGLEGRNLRDKTISQYRQVLNLFTNEHDGLYLSELLPGMIVDWITRRYRVESSRSTTRTRIVSWARWCAAPPRSWLASNFSDGIRWQKVRTDERRIEFLTGAEVGRLLAAASPRIRPGLVVMAFAGVRPYEAQRLTWAEINGSSRSILIPGAMAKTRVARRLHELPDNLWKWLELTPPKERQGRLISLSQKHFREHLREARAAADVKRWPQDCLRHSFGTHGWWRGAEWVVATLGHVSGFDILARHYRGCVGPDEARAYFEIMPPEALVPEKKTGERRSRAD